MILSPAPVPATGRSDGLVIRPNLIANGGFETDLTGWTKAGALNAQTRITSDFFYGAACIEISETSAAGTGEYTQSDKVAVTAGLIYCVSAWVKRSQGTGSNLTGNLNIWWYTSGDAFISATAINVGQAADGAWVKYWKSAAAPGTAAKASVALALDGIGAGQAIKLLFDGIKLEQGSWPTAFLA